MVEPERPGPGLGAALRPIDAATLRRDVAAGLVLASINVPQLLGYARIAGMPVASSLATALLPALAFAVLGSSRHLMVSADSATAAIFASTLSGLATPGSERYAALAAAVALVTAVILLAARLFRLGFLADFLSRTVLVGFLSGIGLRIAIAMLGDMLGLPAGTVRDSLGALRDVVARLPAAHAPTVALSVSVATATLLGRRLAPRLPVPLVAVVAGVLASRTWDFAGQGIAVVGPVRGGLPVPSLPSLLRGDALLVLPAALSCAMVVVAQSAAAARAFAIRHRETLDVDADVLALAAANAAAGLTGSFVVNGGASQTAIADAAGGLSQWTQVTMAAVAGLALVFLVAPLADLPHAVLAGIVFAIGAGMVDVAGLREIRRESRGEFGLALLAALVVGLVGVEEGVLIAVVLSLLRHVRHSYRPYTAVLVPDGHGRLAPEPARAGVETAPGVVAYRFGADLFYANDGHFAAEVRSLVEGVRRPVRWLVVDASAMTNVDWSAARTLNELFEDLRDRGVGVVFGRVGPSLRADMERHGLARALGEGRLLPTLHEAMEVATGGVDATPRGIDSPGGAG